jgi:small subunit ribosomal protein S17
MTSKTKDKKEGEEKVKKKTVKKAKAPARKEEKAPSAPRKKKERNTRDIGVDVTPPERTCNDDNCPFHGTLSVRGLMMQGEVVSDRMAKGAVVKRERLRYVAKYERYEKISSRFSVHNPPCIAAKKGDKVTIMECRPLSKTVSKVIIEKKEGA